MPNIVITHNGKVPHISQNYDRIAKESIPFTVSPLIRYDFSQATQSTFVDNFNTVGTASRWSVTGSVFFERGYNFGTWSGANIHRAGQAYNGAYVYDSTVNQYVMEYAGGTPSGGYTLGTFSNNTPLNSTTSGSATIFAVFKTPTTYPINDVIFNMSSQTYSFNLGWNTQLASNKVSFSFGAFVSGSYSLSHATCDFTANTWCISVATYSFAATSSTSYLKANGVLATGSTIGGFGVSNDSISVIVTATSSATGFKVGEIIMYDGILQTADIAEVESYLKGKWNISY